MTPHREMGTTCCHGVLIYLYTIYGVVISERRVQNVPTGGWRLGAWLLRALLVGALGWGLVIGRMALVVNAGVGLAATGAPLVARRRWGRVVPRSLGWWVGLAAGAHAWGLVLGLYAPPTQFDILTHALSGGVVALCVLAVVQVYDRSTDEVYLPRWFTILVVVVGVMAAGVVWELLEFGVAGGGGGIQTSLTDTVTDTIANVLGGVVAIGSRALAQWRTALDSSSHLLWRADE